MRLLFVPDSHGSTLVLKKSLAAAKALKADILILAGDLSGKIFIPFVKTDNHFCRADCDNNKQLSEEELTAFEKHEVQYGRYVLSLSKNDYNLTIKDKQFSTQLMIQAVLRHLQHWLACIKEYCLSSDLTVCLCPGNDDPYEVDNLITNEETETVRLGKDNVIKYKSIAILSISDVTPTPWSTYRELSDEKIRDKIDHLVQTLDKDKPFLFNFHCPPKPTKLDLAPELDVHLKPLIRGGSQVMTHVGSKAVYDALRKYQPVAGLHGHAHESPGLIKIGNTIAVNPGSEYEQGIMKGFFLEIKGDRIIRHSRVER